MPTSPHHDGSKVSELEAGKCCWTSSPGVLDLPSALVHEVGAAQAQAHLWVVAAMDQPAGRIDAAATPTLEVIVNVRIDGTDGFGAHIFSVPRARWTGTALNDAPLAKGGAAGRLVSWRRIRTACRSEFGCDQGRFGMGSDRRSSTISHARAAYEPHWIWDPHSTQAIDGCGGRAKSHHVVHRRLNLLTPLLGVWDFPT